MSVATFSQVLKVFSAEDNYSSPVTIPLTSNNQTHGRITWSGDGKWLSVAPLENGGGPLPILKYSDKQLQPLKYVTLKNITSASFFNWTNRNIAVGNESGEVFIWDIKEKKIAVRAECTEGKSVDFIAVNSDDAYLASGSLNTNKICIFGLKTNKIVDTVSIPKSNHTSSLKFCMCKKNFLGASSIESTVCVWDIARSDFVFKISNSQSGACTDISFSPINYDVIASVSLTKTLKMYDLRERKLIMDTALDEPLSCVDIILNGDKVAVGTTGGSVIIYDLRADKVYTKFKAHDGPVLSVKTQNWKIPKTYQEVEMNTPDAVVNPSKTLDISVMDIFSPINTVKESSSYQNKSVLFHSTPMIVGGNSEAVAVYEDSFLKKVLSPSSSQKNLMMPKCQSSPYLMENKENTPSENESKTLKQVKEEPPSELGNNCSENGGGGGDGFNVDNHPERNLYYSDIATEIRNSQREVLNEISLIRKDISEIKSDLDTKFKQLQDNYENLKNILLHDIKQEVYAGNCDAKIEHISHRILMNELYSSLIASGDKINEQVHLNTLRLKHIYEIINKVK